MNILVTGGAGFIGSHLCERLLSAGHAVVAIDNFDPLYPPAQKKQNLSSLLEHHGFRFFQNDVRNKDEIKPIFAAQEFDFVFHLAGRGGVPQSTQHPFTYLEEMMLGTMSVLELAARQPVKVLVNASSSSVYGLRRRHPSSERAKTSEPLSIYAALKGSTELLCHAYHTIYGIGIANVRFFSVYGPRGRHDQIVYKITNLIDRQKTIPVVYPDPKRDFTYISDIVDGLERLLQLRPGCYETINLGCGKPEPIAKVIAIVEQALGKKALLGETIKALPSDAPSTHADISLARKLLGWGPTVSLEIGVPKFVAWYEQHRPVD